MALLDRVDDVAKTSEAITLANEIATHFVASTLSIHPDAIVPPGGKKIVSHGVATVRGTLNLSHQNIDSKVIADCSFTVSLDWHRTAPALRCAADWIRRAVDPRLRANWHVNDDDSLCYVLDPEWEDCLADIRSKNSELVIRSAAFYCVNNARWLLYRHLEGYRRHLKDWPIKEWPCWPHAVGGLREYAARKLRHRHLPK
jgi:hypothetical protein